MASHTLLKVMGVGKAFGGLDALNHVSFEVSRRDFFGLIGPNGAGKSVMINVITGLYRPTRGRVSFNGLDITGLKTHQIIRSGISEEAECPGCGYYEA